MSSEISSTTVGRGALAERLDSIDLLRAVAALAVTALHATHHGVWSSIHGPYDASYFVLLPISFGGAGVYLFFVISGFCIHLRWAKATAAGTPPRNDFVPFWKRRLRRLYPAYAAALAVGIAFAIHDGAGGAAFAFDVASHALLVHNLHPDTLYTINPVFWTLAIEEQLYLLYFLFLWMRRRYSWRTILIVCFGVRIAWQAIALVAERQGVMLVVSESAQATWFIWVMGALAVEHFYGLVDLPRWTRSLPIAGAFAIATALLIYLDVFLGGSGPLHLASLLLMQPGWAIASFITLNVIVRRESWLYARRKSPWIAPLLWIGLASYSLYLFHMYVLRGPGLSYVTGFLAAIAAAAVAFFLFERPFIKPRPRPPAEK
ncbi:MAG: acyltransferase [Deltaproteobacteria bacterium]|nr:acyltransferase [Deltaproteobacteria bacterium]MDQ3301475.1 acyltransferase family protein [Myxococcota bacterium]